MPLSPAHIAKEQRSFYEITNDNQFRHIQSQFFIAGEVRKKEYKNSRMNLTSFYFIIGLFDAIKILLRRWKLIIELTGFLGVCKNGTI
jgi:hypothetical protein